MQQIIHPISTHANFSLLQGFGQLTKDAEDALAELKAVVDASRALLATVGVASQEALDADSRVAQASQKAQILAKALQEAKRTQISE